MGWRYRRKIVVGYSLLFLVRTEKKKKCLIEYTQLITANETIGTQLYVTPICLFSNLKFKIDTHHFIIFYYPIYVVFLSFTVSSAARERKESNCIFCCLLPFIVVFIKYLLFNLYCYLRLLPCHRLHVRKSRKAVSSYNS